MKLGEAIHVKHGFAFKGENFTSEGEFVLLTPGNCHETGGLKLKGDKEKFYSGEFPEGYLLGDGDLVVVMTDLVNTAPVLGGAFVIPESGRYLHNQRLGLVTVTDETKLSKKYLYYLLNSHGYRMQIRGSASGATVRHTSPGRIGNCVMSVPDVVSQDRIASIPSAYDDLIENNRRRMALLEESARLLYREWFVHLRFPGHATARVSDGVPEGWRKVELGDICEAVRESVSPDEVDPDFPYIGLEHMPRRSTSLGEWDTAEKVTSNKFRYYEGDILFGKIRPYFHKVGIAFTDGIASSDAIVIRAKEEEHAALLLMTVSSDPFVADAAQSMREGSKMPRADWKQMICYPVMLPPEGLHRQFSETIQATTDQLKTLTFQTQKLKAARDLLLPKLMSGEIEV